MFNLGMGEITVVLLLALIFLGPGKLPDLAAGLGKLIKEIRKATSDVKNEIALDDSFRKPFEELRDAVTLHPDELKRRDEWRKLQEESAKRAAEEAAAAEAAGPAPEGSAIAGSEIAGAEAAVHVPPDGLFSPVAAQGVSHPKLDELPSGAAPGPNDTIVQAVPRGATLDDVPTPPPELPAAAPPARPARPTPAGAVPRPDTLRGVKPVGAPAAPRSSETTQILREEDLMPSTSSGKPPPPPHLPGLRPPSAPRPGVMPPLPPNPLDTKKKS